MYVYTGVYIYTCIYIHVHVNNWLSVNSDYGCILVMLLGLSRNGRLEVTRFSIPTTSKTVSVIQRNEMRNSYELRAPGRFSACQMCEAFYRAVQLSLKKVKLLYQ